MQAGMQHEKTGTIRKFQYLHAQGRGSRKRPAVIFGSDDLEGCKHAVFEILSNAIDEARGKATATPSSSPATRT